MKSKILAALEKLNWSKPNEEQHITYVRTYEICFNRFGRPDDHAVQRNKLR
jgi:hypothetical protein